MENITKDMFDVPLESFTLEKVVGVKPYKGAEEGKQVTLIVAFNATTINQLAAGCMTQGEPVRWQNSSQGRKAYNTLKNHQRVELTFKAPIVADSEQAMIMKLAGMTKAEEEEYIKALRMKAAGYK